MPHMQNSVKLLEDKGKAIDAAQILAEAVEDDPTVDSVGRGAIANINGQMQLDAAVMNGDNLNIGAVAAVSSYKSPVKIARAVMDKSEHNFLVGRGAEDFAMKHNMEHAIMLTESSIKAYNQSLKKIKDGTFYDKGHDTICAVALDTLRSMAVATSTSGTNMKTNGRVGDSPIVGSGYYVDSDIGGAAATGVGESIMKGCMSYLAVQLMAQGLTPQEAAEEAIRKTCARLRKSNVEIGKIAIICADNQGQYGGAANHDEFTYVVASDKIEAKIVSVKKTEIIG